MSGGLVFLLALVGFCSMSLVGLYVYLRRKGRLWGRERLTPREAAHRRLDACALIGTSGTGTMEPADTCIGRALRGRQASHARDSAAQ